MALGMNGDSRFNQQKAWADNYIPEVNRVVRKIAGKILDIDVADPQRDRLEGIDYEVKVVGGSIACRIRRADRYGFRDLTITVSKPSGITPEVEKIRNGSVRWYLYAWAAEGHFVDWMFVDLDKVRALSLIERSIDRGRKHRDPEGGVFVCIPFSELEKNGAVLAYEMNTVPDGDWQVRAAQGA